MLQQIMAELHQDHQHIASLLVILKNKLATLEAGGRPNFSLMAEVMDYLDDYADGYHHAREDLIFTYLRNHFSQSEPLLVQLEKEHQELAELTGKLRSVVEKARLDSPFSLPGFIRDLRRYIDKQGQHLNLEEGKLFPLIEQLMNADDWRDFAALSPQRENPLLAIERHQRFQQLYSALIEDL